MNNLNLQNIDWTSPTLLIAGVVILLAIVAVIALAADRRRKRSVALRNRFGSEYDLAVERLGARNRAEARLLERVRRVEHFKLRDLTFSERERFVAQWNAVQARFVDHPRGAVAEADELVNSVMLSRGFPATDLDQRVEDLSVNHGPLVDSYRSANAIAQRASRNEATTEELRTAMIHYRALFDELLGAKNLRDAEVSQESVNLRRTA